MFFCATLQVRDYIVLATAKCHQKYFQQTVSSMNCGFSLAFASVAQVNEIPL